MIVVIAFFVGAVMFGLGIACGKCSPCSLCVHKWEPNLRPVDTLNMCSKTFEEAQKDSKIENLQFEGGLMRQEIRDLRIQLNDINRMYGAHYNPDFEQMMCCKSDKKEVKEIEKLSEELNTKIKQLK